MRSCFTHSGTEGWDTHKNIAHISADLSQYLTAFPSGKILIFGHSQGGCIAANWAYKLASLEELGKIAGVFFLASPLYQPILPAVWPGSPTKEPRRYYDATIDYSMNWPTLAAKLQRRIVVIRYWDDALAPDEYASALLERRTAAPLSEIIVSDSRHHQICNHHLTLATIRQYLAGIWFR